MKLLLIIGAAWLALSVTASFLVGAVIRLGERRAGR